MITRRICTIRLEVINLQSELPRGNEKALNETLECSNFLFNLFMLTFKAFSGDVDELKGLFFNHDELVT